MTKYHVNLGINKHSGKYKQYSTYKQYDQIYKLYSLFKMQNIKVTIQINLSCLMTTESCFCNKKHKGC